MDWILAADLFVLYGVIRGQISLSAHLYRWMRPHLGD